MTAEFDDLLAALAGRVAAGEAINPASLPPGFADDPRAQALLRFAKVAGALAANATGDPEPPAAPTSAPVDRIGPWRLVRLLGSGGMGDVWLGERADGTVEHRVAIKRVRGASAAFALRLESERRILAKLSHPNIARFVDAGVDATGAPWLALDFIDGATLNAWCERARPALSERLQVFLAVCAAVEHAHRLLIVHRDLKPANVLVDAAGVPHLLDFGVAKLLDGSSAELTAAALTPAYAAPEQLRGGEVSTATDVYALGLLLFRLLAGELPPTRRDAGVAQVLARLDEEETQQPSATARSQPDQLPYAATLLEGDLDAIVSKAIRALPEARYGSVAELAGDIERHLDARPVLARAPTRRYRAGRFVRRHRVAVGFAGLAALALIAGTAMALDQARRANRAAAKADAEANAALVALERAERGQRFLSDLFASASPETNQGRMPTARDLIADGERRLLAVDLPDADRADLAITIAESWSSLGERLAARRALAIASRAIGQDQRRSLARMAILMGRLELLAGDHEAARRHFAHAATLAEAAGPSAYREAGRADFGLGQAAIYASDGAAALAHNRRGYERLAAMPVVDARAMLDARMALGTALLESQNVEEAIVHLQAAADESDRLLGTPNVVACRARNALSDALERRGDYQRAVSVGIESASDCLGVYGPNHWRYGRAELDAGLALTRLGRVDEALARYEAARNAFAATGHFEEGSARRYAALALIAAERWDDAAVALAEAEALLSRKLGTDAPPILVTRLNRALVLNELGDPRQAQSLAEQARQGLGKVLPADHEQMRNTLRVLAMIHRTERRFDQSIEVLEQLIESERRAVGEYGPSFAAANQQLARTLLLRDGPGDQERARTLLDVAVEIASQPGRSPLALADVLLDRAEILRDVEPALAQEDLAAAERAAEQVPTLPPSIRRRLPK